MSEISVVENAEKGSSKGRPVRVTERTMPTVPGAEFEAPNGTPEDEEFLDRSPGGRRNS